MEARKLAGEPQDRPRPRGRGAARSLERAETKRQELRPRQPSGGLGAKVLSAVPRAAEYYRRQIEDGLDGDERARSKRAYSCGSDPRGTIRLGAGRGVSWVSNSPDCIDIPLR